MNHISRLTAMRVQTIIPSCGTWNHKHPLMASPISYEAVGHEIINRPLMAYHIMETICEILLQRHAIFVQVLVINKTGIGVLHEVTFKKY